MVLPKIEVGASSRNYGHFIISPLESGYGITLGNALRRVLLSTLPGAAITSIRLNGVHHEFTAFSRIEVIAAPGGNRLVDRQGRLAWHVSQA